MNAPQQSLHNATEAVNSISVFPDVAMRIREVANDPRAGIRDLANVVKADPILSLRIMKMASSATYGAGRAPKDIDGAVRRLGFRALRDVALAMSLGSMAEGCPEGKALWEHSLAVATACRLLVPIAETRHRESMFLAGLMHDLGRIIILKQDPEWFQEHRARPDDETLCELEQAHFGWDHAILGGQCLRSFGISPEVADVVHAHHTKRYLSPQHASDRAVLTIKLAHIACGWDPHTPPVVDKLARSLELDEAHLAQVQQAYPGEIKRVRAQFGADTRSKPKASPRTRPTRSSRSRIPASLRRRR